MKVTLQVNRQKENDRIVETFSIMPRWSGTFDKQMALYYAIWKLTHDIGIGKDYQLIERKELANNIINVYEYAEGKPIPPLNDKFEFFYVPYMGKKKCSQCIHKRILKDKNEYCKLRGKRLKWDYWYKCEYWQEQFRGNTIRGNSET
jgi:hypothetical protein